jgi:uncharacterized protein
MLSEFSLLSKIAAVLCIIGALNWGLIAMANYNLVAAIFPPAFERFIYALIGLSGLTFIMTYFVPVITHGHEHDMVHHH